MNIRQTDGKYCNIEQKFDGVGGQIANIHLV